MDQVVQLFNGWPKWVVVVMGLITISRQSALLLREVLAVLWCIKEKRAARKRRRRRWN